MYLLGKIMYRIVAGIMLKKKPGKVKLDEQGDTFFIFSVGIQITDTIQVGEEYPHPLLLLLIGLVIHIIAWYNIKTIVRSIHYTLQTSISVEEGFRIIDRNSSLFQSISN